MLPCDSDYLISWEPETDQVNKYTTEQPGPLSLKNPDGLPVLQGIINKETIITVVIIV